MAWCPRMMHIDEQLATLQALQVPETKQSDFDAFWTETVARAKDTPLQLALQPMDYPLPGMCVRDLTFAGLDGTPIRGWLLLPATARGRVPVVVCYHGAGGSRGEPAHFAFWLLAGCAVLTMDFRMQSGLTGSNTGFVTHQSVGWVNMGLLDKYSFYFYHTWTDALRLMQIAFQRPELDPARVAVEGGSQGGGAALAMAALEPRTALCMADVPSMCRLEKRVFDRSGGAANVAHFLRDHPELCDQAFVTLSYFDNLNLASRIRCPVLVSCGLKDPVCPPDTIFAAYNKITAEKEMATYPFGEHGGGGTAHLRRKLAFLTARVGASVTG
jgi:cephalosporin-C deacetylase